MIKVKKSNRVGYTAGCWKITRAQAQRLCKDHTARRDNLPSCGYEIEIKKESGQSWNQARTISFPTTYRAYVANHSNAEFILTDENGILDIQETNNTDY